MLMLPEIDTLNPGWPVEVTALRLVARIHQPSKLIDRNREMCEECGHKWPCFSYVLASEALGTERMPIDEEGVTSQ
jgi:hypothetical protein